MHPLLVALAICIAAVFLEVAAAGSNPKASLKSLRQPQWAPPTWLWLLVGVAYYGACLFSLYLVLLHDPSLESRSRALEFLVGVMLYNALWNIVLFRFRALALSFWLFVPYSLLVLITLYFLYKVDGEAAAPFIPYLLYLPYACAWMYSTWKLN